MTIDEVIEQLEDFRDQYGGEQQVLLAHQPSWPFEYEIHAVGASPDGTVYIAEGAQMGYLSGEGREAVGWGPE